MQHQERKAIMGLGRGVRSCERMAETRQALGGHLQPLHTGEQDAVVIHEDWSVGADHDVLMVQVTMDELG